MIMEVAKDNFDAEVLKSERPVMVDFWGPACAQCLALIPFVEKLSEQYSDKLKIVKMNIFASNDPPFRSFCISLKVMSLPTFVFYKNGLEIKRLTGRITLKDIEKAIGEII